MSKVKRHLRKTREGKVSSSSGDKTIVVLVERRFRHPLYGIEIRTTKKIYAHDEQNQAKGFVDVCPYINIQNSR